MSASDLAVHIETQHANISSKYIKNIIFGGLDGIITTFSIIAAAYGADFSTRLIIIMGTANLLADAVSMGLGEYISSVSENIYINTERNKEEFEYEHNKEYELKEMVALYKGKGMNEQDAQSIVSIIAKPEYKEFFIENMVAYELGLEVPEENYKKINRKEGLVTFISFVGFGFIPVFPYILFYTTDYSHKNAMFAIDCFFTLMAMFCLGYTQAKITKQNQIIHGLTMCGNGTLAASVAFLIGFILENVLN